MRALAYLLSVNLAMTVLPLVAWAQEDFRAADLDRPIRIEDANPIKFREWEFEIGSRGLLEEGARGLRGIFEVKTGLIRNAQFGLEVESGVRVESGAGTDAGLEAASAHLLYGVWRETVSLPALAIRVDVASPGAGAIGHEGAQFGIKGIVTRSFGRVRLHGNGGYTAASQADGGDYWRVGLGSDYPLGLFSRAVLADVYVEIPTSQARSRVWVEVGTRVQVSNWSVLDLGLSTRLDKWDAGDANVELVIGFSRAFGIQGNVDPYPNPSIR